MSHRNLNPITHCLAGEAQYYATASHAIGGPHVAANSMMSRSAMSQETATRTMISSTSQESSFSGFRQGGKAGTASISSKFEQDHASTAVMSSTVSSSAREE